MKKTGRRKSHVIVEISFDFLKNPVLNAICSRQEKESLKF
jgi:hypothetical protein